MENIICCYTLASKMSEHSNKATKKSLKNIQGTVVAETMEAATGGNRSACVDSSPLKSPTLL